MQKNLIKTETNVLYTCWDLNCRSVVPHTLSRNRLEKKIKRMARRKNKEVMKKILDNYSE